MSKNKRNDLSTVDLHPWPIPVNSRALHIVKLVLGAGMIVILLTQVMPANLLGGMLNNLFTIILLLSWAGPARRMMRRYSSGRRNNPSAEEQ